MSAIKYWVVGVGVAVCLYLMMTPSVKGATFVDKDYPYYILEDAGKIRYCMDPHPTYPTTPCWSEGVKTDCKVLPPDAGYIDCKAND